jgi:cobalt-zinc-cadmium efflux system membrane fusion protein
MKAGFGVAALLVLASLADAHEGHAPLPTKGATVQGDHLMLTPKARASIGVETAKVSLGAIEERIEARARVQLPWNRQAMITTLLSGRVSQVLVRPGESVEAGQILATVESLEVRALEHDLLRAESKRSLAARVLAQQQRLQQVNALARADLAEAERNAVEASAEVLLAVRKLRALGLVDEIISERMTTGLTRGSVAIVSPIKGTVVHADVRAGQVVATDEHLFYVVDLSELEVAGEVLENDVPRTRVGQPIEVRVTALPGFSASGKIEHTHLALEPESRALTVIGHFKNADLALKPGMTGTMTIGIGATDEVVVCPEAAIVRDGESPFVLIDRGGGRYERREVKLGRSDKDRTEIRDGAFPGDRVVVTGTNLLATLFGGARAGSLTGTTKKPVMADVDEGRIVAQGVLEVPVDRKRYATSQVEGRIARILVHPGDHVRTGQVIAEIESLPLRSLQLELLQARARLDWLRESVERSRALMSRNATAQVDLWRDESALEVVNHTLDEVRSKLLMLGLEATAIAQLEEMSSSSEDQNPLAAAIPIRSPMDGQLDHFEAVPGQVVVPAEPGRMARPEKPLFEIHDRSRLWVCAHVRETDIKRLRAGQSARVSFPSTAGLEVSGTVVRVSPVLDELSRVLPIWIEIDNRDGNLYEGMRARADIQVTATTPESPRAEGAR